MAMMIETQLSNSSLRMEETTMRSLRLAEICVDAVLPRKRTWEEEESQYHPLTKRVKAVALEPAPKRTTFSEQIMEYDRSYDETDLMNAWYSRQDYLKFKLKYSSAVDAMKMVAGDTSKLSSSACCLRGLEELLIPNMQSSQKNRKRDLVQVVLLAQKLQRRIGVSDPELLRALSERASTRAVKTAVLLGKLDANRAAQLR